MFETKCPMCGVEFSIIENLKLCTMVKYKGIFFLTVKCPQCGHEELSSEEESKIEVPD